jgi:hypothetical protein
MKILFWILVFMVIYQFFIKPARRPLEPDNSDRKKQADKRQKLSDTLPAEDIDYEEIE